MTTRRYAILTAAAAATILTLWNIVSFFESRQGFYAEFSAATANMDPGSEAAMTNEGSASQYLANGLQQLMYAHINLEGAILAAVAIALLWILRMR